MMENWKGKRVLILGAARQGLALARWLSIHGAQVTLSDMHSEDELQVARESLAEFEIQWALGGHPLALLDSTDVLCLSGGIPFTLPIVVDALSRGIPLSNDSQIFMEVVPCKTIGITGSAGKTTTTTLVGNMAKNAHGDRAYVGGNMGDPLLNYVDEMKPEDIAVMELSSFQLDQMTISPNIAAILNVTPNHLDRHGTMEAYTSAKARILEFQSKEATSPPAPTTPPVTGEPSSSGVNSSNSTKAWPGRRKSMPVTRSRPWSSKSCSPTEPAWMR
jgi:UDP-N-acetylmuramoylalanine--D-glutamate ligase